MGHVEVITQGRSLLELASKHILAVVGIGGAVEGLFGAVIKAGNAARGIEKSQRHIEPRGGDAAGAEKAGLVVIVEERHQPHLRRRIVVARNRVVMVFDLFGVAAGRGEHAVDREIERVIQNRILRERAAALRARVRAALGFRSVIDLAEHEEVCFADARRVGVNQRTPVLPEAHLHVFRRINAKSVETRLPDPILVNLHHIRAHVGRLGAKIIQAGQSA